MRETESGLYVEGRLDLGDSEVAREAWRSMRANRVGLSFGYMVTDSRKGNDGVKVLTALDLYEITITPAPANADTRLLSLKALDDEDPDEPPSDDELHREAERLGVLAPDPVRVQARDEMLRLLSHAGNGEATDKAQRAKAKALAPDGPIQVATFEC